MTQEQGTQQEHPARPRLSARKHTKILEAAVSEFRSRGYDNTSMDRVAEVAEVSKRTVYNHFSSKEALFEAMVQRLKQRCMASDDAPFDPQVPLETQLHAIARKVIESNVSDDFQALSRVILARFLHAPELAREMLGEAEEFSVGVATWIRAACEGGQLTVPDPDLAAKQFKGLLAASTFWPQVIGRQPRPSPEEQEAIAASTVAMFLDHYRKR
ncbi:TetR/AcrR family transcriptional regulator [Candidatus Laterigemmans baculatus]|uniref:TetR/AcrR family transcriptional regulator n=1 Tax=Candidatus Laterigemmans baculatus TaxID=2770505 RepID=UPI0013D9939C|nr:TetR/AcrR family transcriptional regulator [Candidatus Laterigemmans baculatus]